MSESKRITYTVRGPSPSKRNSYIVWEHVDGCAVNEYEGYDRGNEFVLYPRRKIIPSVVEMKKQTISIHDTKRAF